MPASPENIAPLPAALSAQGASGARLLVALVAGGVVAYGLSGVSGLVVGSVAIGWPLAMYALEVVHDKQRKLAEQQLERLSEIVPLRADEVVDGRSHDAFRAVGELLGDERLREQPWVSALDPVAALVETVERRLRRTAARRRAWEDGMAPAFVGGLARYPQEKELTMKLYGDPANAPQWLPPDPRDKLVAIGRVVDDVRLLHDEQIERLVLVFTLWSRALLLVLAPTLGAVTAGHVPLDGGSRLEDGLWLAAVGVALATAVTAPAIARRVMAATPEGRRLRLGLLAVEAPLTVALTIAFPAWTVVSFAAGWTNWWQRLSRTTAIPHFSWSRLLVWSLATAGVQTFALIGGGAPAWAIAVEPLATLGVIAIIGGSYGAMMPISAGILLDIVVGGSRHAQLAENEASQVIDGAARSLDQAVEELRAVPNRGPIGDHAVRVLTRARNDLAVGRRRPGGRTPRQLGSLLERAVGDAIEWSRSPRAQRASDEARAAGRAEPVSAFRPTVARDVQRLRLSDQEAKALRLIVTRLVTEARQHGTGKLVVVARRSDGRVAVRLANRVPDGPARQGRGRGAAELERLKRRLPEGEVMRFPDAEASFVDLPGNVPFFGVEVSFNKSDASG